MAVIALTMPTPQSAALDAKRVEPSIYKIYTIIANKDGTGSVGSGTGFLVNGKSFVVTNFHVVEGGVRFLVGHKEGREVTLVDARLVDTKPHVDLALLETTDDLPGTPLRLADYEPDKLVDLVAIGFPAAANLSASVSRPDATVLDDLKRPSYFDSTATTGAVSRMTSVENMPRTPTQIINARTVQHNAAINPGNSGGPLFDKCGNVVGVNTWSKPDAQGLFFSVHSAEVIRFLREQQISPLIAYSACGGGPTPGLVLPLVVGMSATLALAALTMAIRKPAALKAIGQNFTRFAPAQLRNLALVRQNAGTRDSRDRAIVLRPSAGGNTYRLNPSGREATIGRGPGVDFIVQHDTVSKVHARLRYDNKRNRLQISDIGSSNGTYVDGRRVTEGYANVGSRIRFGSAEFYVSQAGDSAVAGVIPEAGRGWMLSGFDPSGRPLQFQMRTSIDRNSGREAQATWTVGRDKSRANLVIDDTSVSGMHAQFSTAPGQSLMLRDAGSTNGTRIDGKPIGSSPVPLDDIGQEISFGAAVLRLSRLNT